VKETNEKKVEAEATVDKQNRRIGVEADGRTKRLWSTVDGKSEIAEGENETGRMREKKSSRVYVESGFTFACGRSPGTTPSCCPFGRYKTAALTLWLARAV
jgi:hypothetical protein